MMRLPSFRYFAPATAREAAGMLSDNEHAMPVAGGTDLYPNMKRRQFEPNVLVGLRRLRAEDEVRRDSSGSLTIDALATLRALERNDVLLASQPAVATAASLVSSPILRSMGTIGGNLCIDTRCNYYNQNYEWREAIDFCMKKDGSICWVAPSSPRCWAISSSDTAPVFIALGAECTLVAKEGERRVPVEELYRHDGIDFLQKQRDEILTAVHLPPPNGVRATYLKLRRRDSIDFPILGVAAAISLARDATVTEARIVLTAVESAPVRATEAESFVTGKQLTKDTIEQAAAIAYRPAKPLDNTDLTHAYRKKMARVYVARALEQLASSS